MTSVVLGLFLIVICLVAIHQAKRIIKYSKLQKLITEFTSKWNVLSHNEKVGLLYASRGKELRDCLDAVEEIYLSKKNSSDAGMMSIELDGVYDWMDRIFQECPRYEILTGFDLDVAFNVLRDEQISQIGSNFEYDVMEVQASLEYLFSNRAKLAEFFNERKKEFVRQAGSDEK